MMLGTDPVKIDAYGCRLMGLDLKDVPYIRLAEEWGAGSTVMEPEDIVRLNEPDNSMDYPAASGKIRNLVKNVSADSACSACYASLVRALYIAEHSGIPVRDKISIGQGYQGKTIDGIGIGRCCVGAERNVKGCPPTADSILELFRE